MIPVCVIPVPIALSHRANLFPHAITLPFFVPLLLTPTGITKGSGICGGKITGPGPNKAKYQKPCKDIVLMLTCSLVEVILMQYHLSKLLQYCSPVYAKGLPHTTPICHASPESRLPAALLYIVHPVPPSTQTPAHVPATAIIVLANIKSNPTLFPSIHFCCIFSRQDQLSSVWLQKNPKWP